MINLETPETALGSVALMANLGREIEESVTTRINALERKLRVGLPEAVVGGDETSSEEEDLDLCAVSARKNEVCNIDESEFEALNEPLVCSPQRFFHGFTKKFRDMKNGCADHHSKSNATNSKPITFELSSKIASKTTVNQIEYLRPRTFHKQNLFNDDSIRQEPESFTQVALSPFHIAASGRGGLISVWYLKIKTNTSQKNSQQSPRHEATSHVDVDDIEYDFESIVSSNKYSNGTPKPELILPLHNSQLGLTSLTFSPPIYPTSRLDTCERLVSTGWDRKVAIWLIPRQFISKMYKYQSQGESSSSSPKLAPPSPSTSSSPALSLTSQFNSRVLFPACVINCIHSLPIGAALCAVNCNQLYVGEYTGIISVYKIHNSVATASMIPSYAVAFDWDCSKRDVNLNKALSTNAPTSILHPEQQQVSSSEISSPITNIVIHPPDSLTSGDQSNAFTSTPTPCMNKQYSPSSNTILSDAMIMSIPINTLALKASKIRATGRVQRPEYLTTLALCPYTGGVLLVGFADGEIEVYDASQPLAKHLQWQQDLSCKQSDRKSGKSLSGFEWGDSGEIFVSNCDSKLKVIATDSTGMYVRRKLTGHAHENYLSLKPSYLSNGRLLMPSEDGYIYYWDVSVMISSKKKKKSLSEGLWQKVASKMQSMAANVRGQLEPLSWIGRWKIGDIDGGRVFSLRAGAGGAVVVAGGVNGGVKIFKVGNEEGWGGGSLESLKTNDE
eukprot:GDKJ01005248.1.p1 GENE.GDKJ01005248.1~~GDKJ01005248.1.p1  ORF type:complete len:765 (+),score=135.20 GDKJ01005248.1:106-2295(+)